MVIKNIANWITSLRILCAAVLLRTAPFSAAFWVLYALGALSDLADGPVARGLHQQSETGAKLDSIADLAFALSIFVVLFRGLDAPTWLWLCAGGVAALRFVGYGIGFYRFHTFVSLHTYANKFTGAVLILAPVFCRLLGLTAAGVALCAIAFLSALEEVVLIATAAEPDRNRRSIFLPTGSRAEKQHPI
jgi:phosphatidylglycerophosphate synthase